MDFTPQEWEDKRPIKQVGTQGRWHDTKGKWAYNPENYAKFSKLRDQRLSERDANTNVNIDTVTRENRQTRSASVPPPTVSSIDHEDDASWEALSDLGYSESHVSAGFVRSFLTGGIDELRSPGERHTNSTNDDSDIRAATAAQTGGLITGRDGNLIATDAGLNGMNVPHGDIDNSPSSIVTSGRFPEPTNGDDAS